MEKPDIRELRAALALVSQGGFAGAALKLGITQPAVSARIAKLEQVLGFPLFYRRSDGTSLTDQGRAILPLIIEIESEFSGMMSKASYWKRAKENGVKILLDGSLASQALRFRSQLPENLGKCGEWGRLEPEANWIETLTGYEADLVLAGSFLEKGGSSGIRTVAAFRQSGVTTAWNPAYHPLKESGFSFPDAVSSTVILPAETIAMGFRDFIRSWCEATYAMPFLETITVGTEVEAIEACRQGIGVLVMPGDLRSRFGLEEHGLRSASSFVGLLPNAYTYGIRYRAEERNPGVLAIVDWFRRSHQFPGS